MRGSKAVPAKAFALTELLVVVGILTLLLGLALGLTGKVRESAAAVQCQSNLRQIAQAELQFIGDNQGIGVVGHSLNGPLTPPVDANTQVNIETQWYYEQITSTTKPPATRPLKGGGTPSPIVVTAYTANGFLLPYLSDTAVLECPSIARLDLAPAHLGTPDNAANSKCPPCSYAANRRLHWFSLGSTDELSQTHIQHPSETLMLCDGISVITGSLVRTDFIMAPILGTRLNRPSFHGRHGGMGNVAWCDGHVSSEMPYPLSENIWPALEPYRANYQSMAKLNVGYLTSLKIDNTQFIDDKTFARYGTDNRINYWFWTDKDKKQ